jgi:hypothetical protein
MQALFLPLSIQGFVYENLMKNGGLYYFGIILKRKATPFPAWLFDS